MINIENKKYWIWYSLIKNLEIKKKIELLRIYGNPEKIYNLSELDLMNIDVINELDIQKILKTKDENNIDLHIKYMNENNIDLINITEKEYPQILKNIYDPPICLYIKGNKNILNTRNIGIIGCRECSEYGKQVAKYFGYNISLKNINIVSGLAKGIDSYSHIGCLSATFEKRKYGKPIAILGNGLDMIYPKENIQLSNKILEFGGAIISEFPLGTKPEKINFPARNRIISGMCNEIIVVEAKKQSGTLITVDFALEQGRDVYVVPGNINSINSIGTNNLIKQGAKLITNFEEII